MEMIEFDEIRKQNNITDIIRSYPNGDIYSWNDINIHCSYGIINISGDITEDLIKKVYEKYPKKIVARTEGKNYLIFSKEALEMFLVEVNNKLAIQNGDISIKSKKFKDEMAIINYNILKKINPSITAKEWIENDLHSKIECQQSPIKKPVSKVDKEIAIALKEFDSTVNPFIKNGVNLKDMYNYKRKVTFGLYSYNGENDPQDTEKNINVDILIENNKDSSSQTKYSRHYSGMSYILDYCFGDYHNFRLIHDYSDDCFNKNNQEESENNFKENVIIYYAKDQKFLSYINYNLTTGTIETECNDIKPVNDIEITDKQKKVVLKEILKAISYASVITKSDYKKENQGKKLVLKK